MNEQKIQKYQDQLNDIVARCAICSSHDGSEVIWLGFTTDLHDLLSDMGVDETKMEEILADYDCPFCRAGLNEPYAEVQIKTIEERIENQIFKKVTKPQKRKQVIDFYRHLEKYPYLGNLHQFGKKILRAVKEGKKININDRIWYRSRLLNKESRLFNNDEMAAPDPHKVIIAEGRFNHAGQSFLYLSEDEKTAFLESRKTHKEELSCMQKYQVNNLKNVLDLRYQYSGKENQIDMVYSALQYNGFMSVTPNEKSSWKPEYFIPRYICDTARHCGYNGVIYYSVLNYKKDNLMIFTPNNKVVSPIEAAYAYQPSPYLVWSQVKIEDIIKDRTKK